MADAEFRQNMALDQEAIVGPAGEFSEPVVYSPLTGPAKSISAQMWDDPDMASAGPSEARYRHAVVLCADVVLPQSRDCLTDASGVAWRVDRIVRGNGVTWELAISTDQRGVMR